MLALFKHLIVAIVGALAGFYLLNPGWGIIDIVPDNLAGVGNLDEVVATLVFVRCLAYFGIELPSQRRTIDPPKSS